jgi:penicillin-binding protein 1A
MEDKAHVAKAKWSIISLMVISLVGGLFFGYILSEVNQGKELAKLATYQPTTPTRLYDIHGVPFSELYRHKQNLVKFADIPPHVVGAFLSIEDDRFFHHIGIDFTSIIRAALVNLYNMRIVQGGSTLTQQLAKTVLQNRKKTFARKFLEAILTLQIEQEYSKEEILEIYFNLIYLGHGTTGLSSAANTYFQKDVRDLTIAEAALLARLPKAPVKYSPYRNPEIARGAHMEMLKVLARNKLLEPEDVRRIHSAFWEKYWPIVITQSPSRSAWGTRLNQAPHFTEWVRQQLEKQLGEDAVYTGGLKVYTTIDINRQTIAEEELRDGLRKQDRTSFGASSKYVGGSDRGLADLYSFFGNIFPVGALYITSFDEKQKFKVDFADGLSDSLDLLTLFTPSENENQSVEEFKKYSNVLSKNLHVEGAVISIDHQTGYIQSMVGGSRFTPKNQFNRAMNARRQVGSSFKPIVYASAIDHRSVGSGTGIMDAPLTTISDEGEGWSPQDISGDFRGMVPLSRALNLSLNLVSVQVFFRTGHEPIIDYASKLTKANPKRFPKSPALALGVAELTPFEMATAYSILANRGRNVIPFGIRYVLDQGGNRMWEPEKEIQEELSKEAEDGRLQIVSEDSAYIARKMLQEVATHGSPSHSLRSPEWANYKGESAGKTGSTSSYTNAWYCGFDPKVTTVVWMGFDKSSISLGKGQTAAALATPIWGKIYRRWYEGQEFPTFKEEYDGDVPPESVVFGAVCSFNGLSPSPNCPVSGNLYLKPLIVGTKTLAVQHNRTCDGDRDHFRSLDLRDFLIREYEITDEELKER